MRHRIRNKKFGCRTSHRKAMMRNMVTSLMEHGRIVTTVTRAKELRRLADRMVTLGKDGSLHARRQALAVIRSRHAVAKLFDEWSPQFADRNGGYTRVVRMGPRRGDATMMAIIELAVESFKSSKKQKIGHKTEERAGVAPASVIPAAAPSIESSESSEVQAAEQNDDSLQPESGSEPDQDTPDGGGELLEVSSPEGEVLSSETTATTGNDETGPDSEDKNEKS